MSRRLLTLVALCLGLVALGTTPAYAEPDPPPKCFRTNDAGDLPTCTWDGQSWSVSYDGGLSDDGFGTPGMSDGFGGPGIPAGFGVLFVLVLLGGGAITLWKISTARQMAQESGLDPDRATAMALLSDDGLDATYLAASLRSSPAPADDGPVPTRTAGDRLRELESLRDEGLVTPAEYDARRQAILDAL